MPRSYKGDEEKPISLPLMEADSNTSTVALQVIGGDEK
jgi:hypothetical protein